MIDYPLIYYCHFTCLFRTELVENSSLSHFFFSACEEGEGAVVTDEANANQRQQSKTI